MSLYGSSGRRYETSAEQFKKYTDQLQSADRTAGTGLSPGYSVQDAMRNQRIQMQQMMYQQQLMQQGFINPNQPINPYQIQAQQMQPMQPVQYLGTPPGFIGNVPISPYYKR